MRVPKLPSVSLRSLIAARSRRRRRQRDRSRNERGAATAQIALAGVISIVTQALPPTVAAQDAPAHRRPTVTTQPQLAWPEYLIAPGDELTVAVFAHPELSRSVHVAPDGYISFPLAGQIRAAGNTLDALALELQRGLGQFVREPAVTVRLSQAAASPARQVRVIGAAARPTAVPFQAGMRVLDVLVAAGGLAATADGNGALLVRGDPAAPQQIPLRLADLMANRGQTATIEAVNIAVQPGDVLVIPEGFFAGNWQREYSLTLFSAFSDNYRLEPAGDESPAVVTGLTPTLRISGKSARMTGALEAALTGQYAAITDSGFGFIPDIVGTSTTELIRDAFYVDAAALVNKQALDPATATSSVANNTTNLTLVQSYQISPYFVSRIRDFAYLEARYNLAGTVTGDTDDQGGSRSDAFSVLSDSITNGAQLRLMSPPGRQSRLDWQALGYGSQTIRFGAGDVTASGFTLSPQYAVWRGFSPGVSGGYESLSVGDDRLSGPSAAAGFEYRPSPNLMLQLRGGWRLENPQADVRLRYQLGPATRLTAAYSDSVGVGQSTLIDTLSEISYDAATRQFVNRETALPYLASLTGVSLEDTLVRTQQATVTLDHTSALDLFNVSAYFTRQDRVDGQSSDRADALTDAIIDRDMLGFVLGWTRSLTNNTAFVSNIGFFHFTDSAESEAAAGSGIPSEAFDDFRLRLGLTRQLTDTVSASLDYYFQRRFADDRLDEFTENAVLLSVTRRF
jgi:polysaccharide export outer membrane protein